MARPPRIEYPGAFYHVTVRGNQRQDIFLDDADRESYLERVQRYKEKRGFLLYAYVLMTNHVHLLIETSESPLSSIMQLINFTHTQYFNRKYGKVGHLFQGRYKAFLCDRDEYLLALVRYIHLNAARAKLTVDPGEYRWSSHRDYLGTAGTRKKLTDTDKVLRLFSERGAEARRLYAKFVGQPSEEGKEKSFYNPVNQQILGNEKFIEKIKRKVDLVRQPIRKPLLPEIMAAIEELTGVGSDELIARGRRESVVFARSLLAAAWREVGWPLVRLQPTLKRDLSRLSRLSKVAESAKGRKALREILDMLNARKQA